MARTEVNIETGEVTVIQEDVPAYPPPTPTLEEEAARIEELTDSIMEQDRRLRAVVTIVFELYDKLAANGEPGFPVLTNVQKRAYVKSKL